MFSDIFVNINLLTPFFPTSLKQNKAVHWEDSFIWGLSKKLEKSLILKLLTQKIVQKHLINSNNFVKGQYFKSYFYKLRSKDLI